MRIPLYLLLLLLFFKTSTLLILVASSQDPSPSLLALLDIKSSLQGSPSSLADWTFSGGAADNFSSAESYGNDRNPWCTWRGIKCDAGTGEVVSLDLSSGNFTGQIPEKIRQLTHLKELNLSRNKFSGPFPAAILSLTSLESLDISRNTFNSTFPPEITRLQSLTYLNTYSNNFGGPLPPELSGLGGLDYLSLGGSEFTGSVPRSYGQLRNLKFLYLAGNKLTGAIPPELGSLNQLWWLEIGYNNFTGGIPPELGQATNLSYLSLADTGLSGPIPPEIGNLTKLETLFLFQNRLSGEIPRSFGNLRALSNLDMSQNRLTGTIPLEFGLLESLASINLMSNELYGEVPPGIAELPHLAIVWLWKNRFTGELPQSLGSNGKVAKVDASSNAFSGPIPPGLCNGNKLVRLILFGNQFSGPIPPALANCTSLTRLRIQDNRLNGSIPRGFGGSPDLAFVDLSNNRLSGKIPEDLLAGASYLNISGNAFDSELPESIWRSPTLQVFSASASSLVGTIPSFAGCKNVYKIELAGNSLNGSIPWDVDSCRKLITLLLARNSLTGSIPWEISALPSIADVDLSQNLLTGGIPRNFSNCNTVENFNVSYNNLSGPIPSTCTVFSNLHHSSFAGNEGLCGGTFLKPCDAQGTGDADRPRRTAGKVLWIMAAAFGVGLFVLVAGSQWLRRRGYGDGGGGGGAAAAAGPWRLTAFQRLNFTAEDVAESVTATDTIVGMGTHGTVYRAEMPGGEIIAVKKLWGQSKEASAAGAAAANHNSHHHRRWQRGGGVQAEVEVLGHVRHRNIVRLIGYCGNSEYTMLLYEYMPNGSLEDLLHGRKKGENLVADWLTRYKIALGVAQGICYLHHDCDPVIVHRDLKPSNILLDAEMEARVADFGVAKLIQSNEAMSVVAGSYGYIAPEYTYTLQVNEKSDIYSYGVVLMEILSGKRCSDSEFGEGNSIVDWVRQKVRTKDGLGDVLDKNVGASCDAVREEMVLVLRVALLCTSRNPADRPSMRDVVSMLQEAKPESKLTGGGTDFGRGGGNTNTVYNVSVIGEGGGDGSSPLFQKSSSLSEC